MNIYQPKDYILSDGFYAAVISPLIEEQRIATTVRYHRKANGSYEKLNTKTANKILELLKPDWLYQSKSYDVLVHGIPVNDIDKHYLPYQYQQNLSKENLDQKQNHALSLLEWFQGQGIQPEYIGITGSLLIGLHNPDSDIDLVIYGRENFHHARSCIQEALASEIYDRLSMEDWRQSYQRRDCAIDLETYIFHEQRKYNKFIYQNTKVDISMILQAHEQVIESSTYRKIGRIELISRVIDDSRSFDLPAYYYLDNPEYPELICNTATYTGQAQQGEMIEISAVIEENDAGNKRLVVGTSREAEHEFIRVIK